MSAVWSGVVEDLRPDARTLEYGHRLAAGLLGIDALYRAEGDDADGLVVLNMSADPPIVPYTFASWATARSWFTELRAEAASLREPDRRSYYAQACASALAFIDWRERDLPFAARLSGFLHVPAQAVAEATIDGLEDGIRTLLGELGFQGDLPARCSAWEQRHHVDPAAVADVLHELLEEAWDRTEATLLRIPAPRADGMRVATVSGKPYNARCDYRSRTIELNIDPILTRPGLRHLAAHEGYPGHYVQFKLRETLFDQGAAPADVLLSVVNTASSSVFEGIADTGLMMTDALTDDDRVQSLLNRHRAAIGARAAWQLHAEGAAPDDVAGRLRARSLIGGEGWVANRMRFIAAPARAVLIWSYWHGEPAVAEAWQRVAPARRPAFLQFLHGRMHSPSTVAMFE